MQKYNSDIDSILPENSHIGKERCVQEYVWQHIPKEYLQGVCDDKLFFLENSMKLLRFMSNDDVSALFMYNIDSFISFKNTVNQLALILESVKTRR